MKCKYKKNLCETSVLLCATLCKFFFVTLRATEGPQRATESRTNKFQLNITQSTLSSSRKSLYRFYQDRE
jgi:hypothetical protein